MGSGRPEAGALGYVEKVPEKFGQLRPHRGLYFGCAGCSRGRMIERAELLRLYGIEGRVADLMKRLTCSNCKAKRNRRPRIYVEVARVPQSASEQARERMCPEDALAYDIARLKPSRKID